jgi:hypothetical protein
VFLRQFRTFEDFLQEISKFSIKIVFKHKVDQKQNFLKKSIKLLITLKKRLLKENTIENTLLMTLHLTEDQEIAKFDHKFHH